VTISLALPVLFPAAPAAPEPSPGPLIPLPSVSTTPACDRGSDLCHWIYQQTSNSWLATGSYYLLVKPLHMLLIVVLALLARHLVHRTVARLVSGTAAGAVPSILKPLKQRLPQSLAEAARVFPERRRQRASAIGSVLNNFATAAIFSVAGLLILAELGVNLAPLIASAGIVGVALGFGAQSLVKDLLAGLFMLLEDQYGVGDVVDVGEASGTVEAVGLRITTIRDVRGVLWYIRNGEIVRVGNKSQGWAVLLVDIPVGFARVDQAAAVMREAAAGMADDPEYADGIIEAPQVLGVEQITADGAVLRTMVKTNPDAQPQVGRELRRRLTDALAAAGITGKPPVTQVYLNPPAGLAEPGTDPGTDPG